VRVRKTKIVLLFIVLRLSTEVPKRLNVLNLELDQEAPLVGMSVKRLALREIVSDGNKNK